MSTTVIAETPASPRITLTKDDVFYLAVLDLDGLDPQRSTTAEERFLGITNLNPPTVRVRAHRDPQVTHRLLIDAMQRAVTASITSTLAGDNGGPVGMLFQHLRTAVSMRRAIRLLGEDI